MSFSTAGPETTGPALPLEANPAHAAHRMREVVLRLAADEFAGRRVGTTGGRAAALWLTEYLGSSGARVRLDDHHGRQGTFGDTGSLLAPGSR